MDKIKVIHISEDLGTGGLERIIAYYLQGLKGSIFCAEAWCIVKGGAIADEIRAKGYPVRILSLPNYYNPLYILRLGYLLRKNRVQILHAHGYFASTMGRLAGILARTPIMLSHVHNSHWTPSIYSSKNIIIDRILSLFSSKVIACSNVARDFQIQTVKINPRKIITIYNCTDVNKISSAEADENLKKEFKIAINSFVIGSVGRLTKVKGHTILLDATVQLIRKIKNLKVLVVGYGPEQDWLKNKSSELGLDDHVVFTGIRGDVHRILHLFDLYVHPTLIREGLPLAIIEAMAAKLPVIATDVGGVKEAVINGKNGFVVPPGRAEELAIKIELLYNNIQLKKRMGEEGYNVCMQKFDIKQMVNNISSLYLEELGKVGYAIEEKQQTKRN